MMFLSRILMIREGEGKVNMEKKDDEIEPIYVTHSLATWGR